MQEQDGRFSESASAHGMGEPRGERVHDAAMRDEAQGSNARRYARRIDCEGPPTAPARRTPHGRGPSVP